MVKIGKHELTSLSAKKLLSAWNKHIKAEKETSKLWSMNKTALEKALQKVNARIYQDSFGKYQITIGTGTSVKFFHKEIDPQTHFTAKHRKQMKLEGEKNVKDSKTHAEIKAKFKKEHDKDHKGRAFRLTETEMKFIHKHSGKGQISITNLNPEKNYSFNFFNKMTPTKQKEVYNMMLDYKAKEEMKKKKPEPKAKKVRKKKPKPEPKNVKIKKKK